MSFDYFLYRFKYRFGRHLPLQHPVDVSLELSSHCNMKCSYCYHSDQDNLPFVKDFMSWPTAKRIIDEAHRAGAHSLKFNWKGESTLNPNFFKITTYAKALARGNVFIDRLTNSNFKFPTTKEEIFEGLCNQTKVKISYDSFRKDVFEKQRSGGNHDVTTRNIDRFYNWPGRKTKMVIQAVRTAANKDEDIAHQVAHRWPESQVSIRDMVSGRVEKDLSEMEVKRRDGKRQACQQAFVRLIFNTDGMAFPCCPDVAEKIPLGHIWHNSIGEIFHGKNACNLRRQLKDKTAFDSEPCRSCSSFETFKGFKPGWNS